MIACVRSKARAVFLTEAAAASIAGDTGVVIVSK